MINITKLYCNLSSESDNLRYGNSHPSSANGNKQSGQAIYTTPPSARERKPIVVWTMSRSCNLHCVHCYTDSEDKNYPNELNVDEGKRLMEDLAQFEIPALLMSGGEPLRHPHFFELAAYARKLGLRITISTNGTLIDREKAERIKQLGVSYVGVSFDGLGKVNDQFRGKLGAFDEALEGIRHLKAVGQRVGLRFTLTRRNYEVLPEIFKFVEREKIDRVCFYHLVYSGRGSRLTQDDLSHEETREVIDLITAWTNSIQSSGRSIEVLTVDNHVDGVYLYLKLRNEDPIQAEVVRRQLEWNGGGANSSGIGIANVDSVGNVHPDQFWQTETFGNVRKRPFSEIWTDETNLLLKGLRNRLPLLKGRCADCQWKSMCGGSFRARAFQVTGDPWEADPGCYLTDEQMTLQVEGKG